MSGQSLLLLNIAFFLVGLSYCVKHEITIYSEVNFGGDSLTLRGKYPDLNVTWPSAKWGKSYCVTGLWAFYDGPNFGIGAPPNQDVYGWGFGSDTKYCVNDSGTNFGRFSVSARYLGPADTDTPAITLYKESGYTGEELIIEQPAYGGIYFKSYSYVLTGFTGWQRYTTQNFTGTPSCLIPEEGSGVKLWSSIRGTYIYSVIRGC